MGLTGVDSDRRRYLRIAVGAAGLLVVVGVVAAIVQAADRDTEGGADTASTTTSSALPSGPWNTTPANSTPPATTGPDNISRVNEAYLDNETADQAYWQAIVARVGDDSDVVVTDSGDMNIAITHEGERVVLYRDDLDSIAFNSCLGVITGDTPAETVGWITDAFSMQRRVEAADIRLAALETKCPTLK